MNLDTTDRTILAALLEDARISQRGLAKRGVAQGTITTDCPSKPGVIKGYVLLDAEHRLDDRDYRIAYPKRDNDRRPTASYCRPRVFAVYDVTGDYDSMVLARVQGRKDLDDLTKTVFTMEGVQRSITQVVLNTVKEDGRVRPASE